MPTYHGLYYPYTYLQDEGWLKAAALYWDHMYRIVPDQMRLNEDTDEIKRFEDAEFVSRRDPYSATPKIAEPFRRLLQSRGSLLEKEFGIGSSAVAKGVRFLSDHDEIAYISDSNIVDNLLKDMKDLRLVILKRRGSGTRDWVGMHSGLARVYMTALAEVMAPEIGARPLADNPLDHAAIFGVTMERLVDVLLECRAPNPNASTEIEVSIATFAFRQVIPQGIRNIPASDIIKFREEYREDRTQFRDEIVKMVKDMDYLRDIKKPEDLARHFEDVYQNRMKGKLERIEKAMKRANWDVVDSALAASWSVPVALCAALTTLGVTLSPVGGAAVGIAIGGWTLWRKRENAGADVLKPSVESYLYHARRNFTAQELVREVEADSRPFGYL